MMMERSASTAEPPAWERKRVLLDKDMGKSGAGRNQGPYVHYESHAHLQGKCQMRLQDRSVRPYTSLVLI
jgi:hypothetical protein